MKVRKMIALIALIAGGVTVAAIAFMNQRSFGRIPSGRRLERILRSPNYDGKQFVNQEATQMMTGRDNMAVSMLKFLFGTSDGLRPDTPLTRVRTDLRALPCRDLIVWFGHSSYLLQVDGRRILVDPALLTASPVPFVNRAFEGTTAYTPDDMPDIDCLVITHDHWDHLDYQTVYQLRDRTRRVVVPLGVGEHFEYWGFAPEQIVELDWNESAPACGLTFHCTPARHFSGRGLTRNKTLWASFVIETADGKQIFIGGDGGYGAHFADIGRRFGQIRLAILENGQYNDNWNQIHTMPQQLGMAARDIGAQKVVTVHHSKYALARHRWDEPLANEQEAARQYNLPLTVLQLGVPWEF